MLTETDNEAYLSLAGDRPWRQWFCRSDCDTHLWVLIYSGPIADVLWHRNRTKVYFTKRELFVLDPVVDMVYEPVESGKALALDETNDKLYLVDSLERLIKVIECENDTKAVEIPVYAGRVTLCWNQVENKLYVVHDGLHRLYVIDYTTDTIIRTLSTNLNPNCLLINEADNRLYVIENSTASVIDCSANTVVTTIPVSASPYRISTYDITGKDVRGWHSGVTVRQLCHMGWEGCEERL